MQGSVMVEFQAAKNNIHHEFTASLSLLSCYKNE